MKPSEGMGFSLDLRKIGSKRQSRSKTAKESDPPKKPEKLESKTNFGSSCTDPYIIGKIRNQESVKGSSTQHDELIKYMSNLPGFLQHSDRGENIQEKALNVGVLDWSQLEKWKNKQTHMPGVASSFTSFNSSGESTSRSRHKKFGDKKGLYSSSIKESYKEDLPESSKVPSEDVKLYQYFEAEPIETKIVEDNNRTRPWESVDKNRSDTSQRKENRNDYDKIITLGEHFASKSWHHSVSLVPDENASPDVEAKKIKEVLQQHSLKKKESNHKSSSHKGLSSLKSKDKGVSYGYQQKMSSSRSKTKKKMDPQKESDFDFPAKRSHRKPSNIVLLRPGKVPQCSSQDYFHLSHFRTSSDEIFSESSGSSLSFSSLPEEAYTEDACSEIPHSCTLPFSAELASSSSETMQHSVNTDQDIDHSSAVSGKPVCSNMMSNLQFEDTSIEKEIFDIKLGNQCAFSNTQESLYQETAGMKNQRGGGDASSHCRLSFSLNRIGKSLSFKEGSTVPQFSSVNVKAKSGPLTFESSASLVNSSKEKVNAHNRTRSSSFRWLLDPILKHKASNVHRSAEIIPSTKGDLNSINLHAENNKGSSVQAVLQLTIKNELPLFKFVLSSERKVLVATMKSSWEKDDIGCYFAFYHLNEIKKKSGGWMSRGSREKSCEYVYNIIGQMKFSRSKITEPKNQNSEKQCVVKEYVLSGVELDQTDQGPPIKSEELGAVVIKIPCENLSHEEPDCNDLLEKGSLKCLADEKCFRSSGENDISFTPTIILPGGVHSSSNQGEPTPLIHRWKSGGLCDCGGWDVGCKLLVLSNQKQCSNVSRSRFQLFVEEGAEHNTPLFSLAPSTDGFYTVEFSSTITHLQAFFISVVLLSSQKLPSTMNKNELQEKASINYNPIPPLSPVGRV